MDRKNVLNALEKSSKTLLFFPEGWDTNTKTGLMVYQKFLFSLGKPILPVALRAWVPLIPVEPGVLGTSVLREVLWLFFYPVLVFDVKFLEPQQKRDGESDVEFAKRVQEMTAKELQICATNYSYKDALQLRSRLMEKQKQE